MPNRSSFGSPLLRTSCASSKTAPSTQPPLTEPASSPPLETAIVAPIGRGAEPSTLTTVAIATRSPASRQVSISGSKSFTTVPPHSLRSPDDRADIDDELAPVSHGRFRGQPVEGRPEDR